jgi:hypothetical protein
MGDSSPNTPITGLNAIFMLWRDQKYRRCLSARNDLHIPEPSGVQPILDTISLLNGGFYFEWESGLYRPFLWYREDLNDVLIDFKFEKKIE